MKANIMFAAWCVVWLAVGWCVATRIVVAPPPVKVRPETVAEAHPNMLIGEPVVLSLPDQPATGALTDLHCDTATTPTTGTLFVRSDSEIYYNIESPDWWEVYGPGKPGDVCVAIFVRQDDGSWRMPLPGSEEYKRAFTSWSPATPIRATDGGEPRIMEGGE